MGNFPFSPVKDREAGQIRQAAASVGLNWDENLRLWQRDKELWLFPVGIEALIGKVRFSRPGLNLPKRTTKVIAGSMKPLLPLPPRQCERF